MATLEERIIGLAQVIGNDVKAINTAVGNLANLSTTQKSNLVAALNEIVNNAGALSTLNTVQKGSLVSAINEVLAVVNAIDITDVIDDTATTGDTNSTYSADRILYLLDDLRSDILGGIPPSTLDTIAELASYLSDNSVTDGIVSQLGLRVRVDAVQSFNSTQQAQARDNIGAVASSAVGGTDRDFAADYITAKS